MAKKRVAVYLRLRGESDVGKLVKAYESQIKGREDCEFADIYVDQGYSGRNKDRPMFQRLIADAKAGKIDYIICKSVEMFSRDITVSLNTVRELRERGVGIYFEVEKINTLDLASQTMLTLYSTMADFEQQLREKEKQFEAEHPEWLEEDFEEPDEPDEFD